MAAEKWRAIVATHDYREREKEERVRLTPEKKEAELAAVALLFEAFLESPDAKDAARMCARFNGHIVILVRPRIIEGCERGEYYDIFGEKGLVQRERDFGGEYAMDITTRTLREIVMDWMSKTGKRAYEFLPWLFAEFNTFADKQLAEFKKNH